MNILILEGDTSVGQSILARFEENGHRCTWVTDADRGLHLALELLLDAVVIDLSLPRFDGRDVLARMRALGIRIPAVLFSSPQTAQEQMAGVAASGSGRWSGETTDGLPEEFNARELLERVEAVHRRSVQRLGILEAGALTLDLNTRYLSHAERKVELTPIETRLLGLLMRRPSAVVTRKILCEHVWDSAWDGSTNVIEVHMNRLRQKIDRVGAESCIHTVRGRGYVFRAP